MSAAKAEQHQTTASGINWFNNLKCKYKLGVGFAVVVCVATSAGAVGLYNLKKANASTRYMYQNLTAPLGDLGVVAANFQQNWKSMREAVYAGSEPEDLAPIMAELKRTREDSMERLDRVGKTLSSQEEQEAFDQLVATRKEYPAQLAQAMKHIENGEIAEASGIIHGSAFNSVIVRQQMLLDLINAKIHRAEITVQNNEAAAKKAYVVILTAMGLSFLLAGIISMLVARLITGALSQAITTTQKLSSGDLRLPDNDSGLPVSTDEMGLLARSMHEMQLSLRQLMSQNAEIAQSVTHEAEHLSGVTHQIAQGAEQAAAQITTAATASEEMAATSHDIASNCHAAAESAQGAADTAQAGFVIVKKTVDGIRERGELTRKNAEAVALLGERSDQIGKVAETIRDIADQTNLLALNAAIEAARAGEMGRGFAVVADEVRALAERTTKATAEINETISTIQTETQSAMASMDSAAASTQSAAIEAQELETSLQDILDQVNNVAMQVSQIATAAEEQTATTNEISNNILNVSEVVQSTAVQTDDTTKVLEKLRKIAGEMQQSIARFRL